jgi:hypothetical protein
MHGKFYDDRTHHGAIPYRWIERQSRIEIAHDYGLFAQGTEKPQLGILPTWGFPSGATQISERRGAGGALPAVWASTTDTSLSGAQRGGASSARHRHRPTLSKACPRRLARHRAT